MPAKSKTPPIPQRTTASEWRAKVAGEDLTLPSGNVALVRRPGMDTFLREGVIPDSLTPIVEDAVKKGKGLSTAAQKEMLKDPKQIAGVIDLMDAIVVAAVIEPKVKAVPKDADGQPVPFDERGATDCLYADEVDLDDKVFIMNFAVGGTRDLERFRGEHAASVAAVQPGEDLEVPSK